MEIDQAKKFFEKTTKPHYLTSEIINLQNQFKDNLEWIERCSNGLEETFGDKTYLKVQWGIDSRYWDMESNDYLKVQPDQEIVQKILGCREIKNQYYLEVVLANNKRIYLDPQTNLALDYPNLQLASYQADILLNQSPEFLSMPEKWASLFNNQNNFEEIYANLQPLLTEENVLLYLALFGILHTKTDLVKVSKSSKNHLYQLFALDQLANADLARQKIQNSYREFLHSQSLNWSEEEKIALELIRRKGLAHLSDTYYLASFLSKILSLHNNSSESVKVFAELKAMEAYFDRERYDDQQKTKFYSLALDFAELPLPLFCQFLHSYRQNPNPEFWSLAHQNLILNSRVSEKGDWDLGNVSTLEKYFFDENPIPLRNENDRLFQSRLRINSLPQCSEKMLKQYLQYFENLRNKNNFKEVVLAFLFTLEANGLLNKWKERELSDYSQLMPGDEETQSYLRDLETDMANLPVLKKIPFPDREKYYLDKPMLKFTGTTWAESLKTLNFGKMDLDASSWAKFQRQGGDLASLNVVLAKLFQKKELEITEQEVLSELQTVFPFDPLNREQIKLLQDDLNSSEYFQLENLQNKIQSIKDDEHLEEILAQYTKLKTENSDILNKMEKDCPLELIPEEILLQNLTSSQWSEIHPLYLQLKNLNLNLSLIGQKLKKQLELFMQKIKQKKIALNPENLSIVQDFIQGEHSPRLIQMHSNFSNIMPILTDCLQCFSAQGTQNDTNLSFIYPHKFVL
ncbi:MAG TPA: hypothetical protein PLQ36_00405, partial [Candidatus Gracilibacteria bacterium]|nr:hypothetical protein [Candidatus Gracilibacteria bacterium]